MNVVVHGVVRAEGHERGADAPYARVRYRPSHDLVDVPSEAAQG